MVPMLVAPAFRHLVMPRGRRLFEPLTLPMYLLLGLEAAVIAGAVASGSWAVNGALMVGWVRDTGTILLFAWAARLLGFVRVAASIEWLMLSFATVFGAAFMSAVLASTALPLADPWLGAADRLMGVDRPAIVSAISARHWAMQAALWIYNSLALTPPLLALALMASDRTNRAWTILTASTLALVGAIAVMPLVPAHGAQNYSFHAAATFDGLRAGSIRRLDESVMTGLVVFPSLHAACAAILAWGFAQLGRWAAPLVVMHILMIGTALVVGGHYAIDLLAGLLLAWAAVALALRLERRLG